MVALELLYDLRYSTQELVKHSQQHQGVEYHSGKPSVRYSDSGKIEYDVKYSTQLFGRSGATISKSSFGGDLVNAL